jgi:hypothetical protein
LVVLRGYFATGFRGRSRAKPQGIVGIGWGQPVNKLG